MKQLSERIGLTWRSKSTAGTVAADKRAEDNTLVEIRRAQETRTKMSGAVSISLRKKLVPSGSVVTLILLGALLRAGSYGQALFPSSGEDPHTAGGAALLETVRPGHVANGKEIGCTISCPQYTGYPGADFLPSKTSP